MTPQMWGIGAVAGQCDVAVQPQRHSCAVLGWQKTCSDGMIVRGQTGHGN